MCFLFCSVAGSLMPGPPPTKKYGENKQLTFLASLLSGTVDDKDRRFVISFYVMDNTLKVTIGCGFDDQWR